MKNPFISALSAVLVPAGVFAGIAVDYDASQKLALLGDGAISVAYDGDKVKTLTATPPSGEEIVLSGDAMTFADGSEIILAAPGKLAFVNELAGEGAVSVRSADAARTIEYRGEYLATNAWSRMFTGVRLDDYAPLKSVSTRGDGENGVYDAGVYYPYNVRRYQSDGSAEMSVQFMAASRVPAFTRILMVRLRQQGDDIMGIVDRAIYMQGRVILGEDAEKLVERNRIAPEAGLDPAFEVHTPTHPNGYGLRHLVMEKVAPSAVEIRSRAAQSLKFMLAGSRLTLAGVALNSEVGGSGTLAFEPGAEISETPTCDSYDGFIVGTSVTVSPNRRLSTLKSVEATITGSYMSGKHWPAVFLQTGGNDLCITGELQVATDIYTWRFVRVEFSQVGLDIKAKALAAGYVQTNPKTDLSGNVGVRSVYEPDFDASRTVFSRIAGSDKGAETGAFGYKLEYSEPAAAAGSLDGGTVNTMALKDGEFTGVFSEEMKFVVGGGAAARTVVNLPGDSAPINGVVDIRSGGELIRKGSAADADIAGGKALLRVGAGGRLHVRNSQAFDKKQTIVLDGGEIVFRDDMTVAGADSWTYINSLALRDGAKITGRAAIRIGTDAAAQWRVSGSAPSKAYTSIIAANFSSNSHELNVLDVTDDDKGDFFLYGDINSASGSAVPVRKTGGGTLVHSGVCANSAALASLRIEGGAWRLQGASSPNQDYTIAGGALEADGGGDIAVGRLVVAAAGRLKVAAGTRLNFADSSSVQWMTAAGRVEVEADLASGAVRFGTGASALTSAQLRRLKHNGHSTVLDENGYLRENDAGFFLIVK